MLFSREGQRAITRALQRGFEAVAGAAHACEDEAEAEALAGLGLAEGGVLAGLLDGGGDVRSEALRLSAMPMQAVGRGVVARGGALIGAVRGGAVQLAGLSSAG